MIMSVLEYRCNKWTAIIAPSVLFGLLHIFNIIGGGLDLVSAVQLVTAGSVVGILFSLITYSSQSIWNSALVHGVWNALVGVGIIHIGTVADGSAIFNFVIDNRSFLLSGGDFGIEASVVAIAVYLAFACMAVCSKRLYTN